MTTPASTYRIQLHKGFTLDDATAIVEYLAQLGVTHLYLSPILQSAPGSTHGYDGVDPTQIDQSRGGRPAFDRLLARCRQNGMGLVLDIVPNHLCITSPLNRWWRSVLRLGSASPYARFFDIDWDSSNADGRVILPILGRPLDEAIDDGELKISLVDGEPCLTYYFDHHWPLNPDSVTRIESDSKTPEALDASLARFSRPDLLRELIAEQHYIPMYWKTGGLRVNYRRFFDIDSLAAVRVEDPEVFDQTHKLILELAALDGVDGLRVDHPDGLRDPQAYFAHLAEKTGGLWTVAEKILETDERLPGDWPVAGTSGYDFLSDCSRLLIAQDAQEPLDALYRELTGDDESFDSIVLRSKRHSASNLLAADLDRLVRLLKPLLGDWQSEQIAAALIELAAALPVYRTYLTDTRTTPSQQEQRFIDACLKAAGPTDNPELLSRIASILWSPQDQQAREAAIRFQQFSAPATAKGVEDTAFYRYHRFSALNEVGGDPAARSLTPAEFHERTMHRAHRWPQAMLATSTHDTKRSEDVRARLSVLSEIPDQWASHASQWCTHARNLAGDKIDTRTIYLLIQTLIGAWPIEADRLKAYMTKATREAKERTSWREPDENYELAIHQLIDTLLADEAFRRQIDDFVTDIRAAARTKSLIQTTLRLTCPGVPDTYQGCELWDLSLVDPDNRRPVDYGLRQRLLAQVVEMSPEQRWSSIHEPDDPGVAKLWLTRTLLHLRRERPDFLGPSAAYRPIQMLGADADHAITFARGEPNSPSGLIVMLPTMTVEPSRDAVIELPTARHHWRNLCDGRAVEAARFGFGDLTDGVPFALLTDTEEPA